MYNQEIKIKHILKSQQFDDKFLMTIFYLAKKIKNKEIDVSSKLKGKIGVTLFYEPSTRTRMSFESAIQRLGGSVILTENASQFSSAIKGESLEDSIRVISSYCDFIILRHCEDDSSERASLISKVPIINAGSGKGQHPTQTLLDLFTIYENFNRLDNLKILVAGDLLRGRTVNSLLYLLSKFDNNKFYFVSPKNCKIKDDLKEYLLEKKCYFEESDNLDSVLPICDILYMTRIQKERFESQSEYENAKGKLILNSDKLKLMKEDSIILHPLPRVDEISVDVDNDKRAKYFDQAENGLYVRMALLINLFE